MFLNLFMLSLPLNAEYVPIQELLTTNSIEVALINRRSRRVGLPWRTIHIFCPIIPLLRTRGGCLLVVFGNPMTEMAGPFEQCVPVPADMQLTIRNAWPVAIEWNERWIQAALDTLTNSFDAMENMVPHERIIPWPLF